MYVSYIEMGERIAGLRKTRKLSQERLADELDISVKHMSEVERGLSSLSLDKLVYLCSVLTTSLDYIVRGVTISPVDSTNLPDYIYETYNSSTKKQQELLEQYIRLFNELKKS